MGLISFKEELQSRFHVTISDRRLKRILLQIPEYLQNQLKQKRFERRPYHVHGFAELYQVSLFTKFTF